MRRQIYRFLIILVDFCGVTHFISEITFNNLKNFNNPVNENTMS